MYYEEQIIRGILCYRKSPDGEWVPFTLERLTAKLTEVKEQLNIWVKAYNQLVETLRDLEWEGDRSEAFCLACGASPKEGHTPDCRVATALAPFKEDAT